MRAVVLNDAGIGRHSAGIAGVMWLGGLGIAPPEAAVANPRHLWRATPVSCPRCGSRDSERLIVIGT